MWSQYVTSAVPERSEDSAGASSTSERKRARGEAVDLRKGYPVHFAAHGQPLPLSQGANFAKWQEEKHWQAKIREHTLPRLQRPRIVSVSRNEVELEWDCDYRFVQRVQTACHACPDASGTKASHRERHHQHRLQHHIPESVIEGRRLQRSPVRRCHISTDFLGSRGTNAWLRTRVKEALCKEATATLTTT
eukprot:scaffold277_cov261-Pinguiococcus_pyrenoidosus.AAC.8